MTLLDLKIGPRVALSFGAVVLTIVALVGATEWSLMRSAANSARMGLGVELQSAASEIHLQAKDNAIASMTVLVAASAEQAARLQQQIAERDRRIDDGLKKLAQALAGQPDDMALIEEIRKREKTYQAGVKRIIDLVRGGKQAEAAFTADEEMIPMMGPFLAAVGKLEAQQASKVALTERANRELIVSTQWVAGVVGVLAALVAAGAGTWVVLSVTRPLASALRLARQVAAGDLTARVHVRGRDEVMQLLAELDRMSQGLAELVRHVRQAADGIATSSREIATGNLDLSQRTEVQASALQATATSMKQLEGTVNTNAQAADEATRLAGGASDVAVRGGEVFERVVQTMQGISDSSRRIADITGVIDSIAFQTNILALNAAVEAARAGEQGRGFAVVAGEVRSLAQRSATAAREIKALIGASVEQVGQGTAFVDQAGGTMKEIVSSIGRVSDIMSGIDSASRSQRSEMAQVGRAVEQMDLGTQQNAALVEQSAAAAESLRQQAERLVQAVQAFKIADERA